jgi:hypothetical protein
MYVCYMQIKNYLLTYLLTFHVNISVITSFTQFYPYEYYFEAILDARWRPNQVGCYQIIQTARFEVDTVFGLVHRDGTLEICFNK